jgi:ankyrin repeat protein
MDRWNRIRQQTLQEIAQKKVQANQNKVDPMNKFTTFEPTSIPDILEYVKSPLTSKAFEKFSFVPFTIDINLEVIGYTSDTMQNGIHGGCLPDINKKITFYRIQATPLIKAIRRGGFVVQSEEMPGGIVLENPIVQYSEYFEVCDEFKQPAIHHHVERYDLEAIEKSPDIKSIDCYGFTPALLACSAGLIHPVQILLKRNADFSSATHHGLTPLLAALQTPHRIIAQLLLENPSKLGDLNRCPESGMTALHWAAFYDFVDLVEILLAVGVNPMLRTQFDDYTPAHLAAKYGNSASLNILIQQKGIITVETKRKETLLHVAASVSLTCVKLLLDARCPISRNAVGQTPIDIALKSGRFDIAMLLNAPENMIRNYGGVCTQESKNNSTLFNALRSASTDIVKNYISNKIHQKYEFKEKECMELVEAAIIGRDSTLIEILSQIVDFAKLNICKQVAEAGLYLWLSRLQKFGVTLSGLHIIVKFNNPIFLDEYLKIVPDQSECDLQKAIEVSIQNKAWKSITKLVSHLILQKKKISVIQFLNRSIPLKYVRYLEKINVGPLPIGELAKRCTPNVVMNFICNEMEASNAISGALGSRKIDTVFAILKSFPNARNAGSFANLESRRLFVDKIRKSLTGLLIHGKDAKKRSFHQIIGDNDVSELQIDEIPLFYLAILGGHFWVLECLPQGIDFQRKKKGYSIFGHVARLNHSFEEFFRALIIHFGQQAKVLEIINMKSSKEIQAFHKSDDFVQSLLTIFDKKQPGLWRVIGQFSDLRREISQEVENQARSVGQFKEILNDPGPDLTTAAMFVAHSRQLKLLTSYLNVNICQASDSSGNTILHHLFYQNRKVLLVKLLDE